MKIVNFFFLFSSESKQTIGKKMDKVEEKGTTPNTGLIQSKPSKTHVLDIKSIELNWVISLYDKGGEIVVH